MDHESRSAEASFFGGDHSLSSRLPILRREIRRGVWSSRLQEDEWINALLSNNLRDNAHSTLPGLEVGPTQLFSLEICYMTIFYAILAIRAHPTAVMKWRTVQATPNFPAVEREHSDVTKFPFSGFIHVVHMSLWTKMN